MAVRVKDRIEGNIRQSDKVNNSLSINGKTFNGSATVNAGVIGAAYGGTGQTTLVNSANVLINALGIGTTTPIDQDYYISQYVGGGTTTTTYHRRPHSSLYTYIKNKAEGTWGISITGSATKATQDGNGNTISSTYLPLTGGNVTGILRVYNTQNNGFFLHRNSGTEAVKHYLNDSQYILEYTNDEKSNSIVFKFINTDMETNAGANPSSAQITFTCSDASKTTITANNFAGNASTASKLGTSTVGSSTGPIYLSSGTATACSGRTVPGIKGASAVSTLGWGTNNNYVPDISLLAYWNGAYSGTSSNLAYCNKGAFGTIVTKSTSDYLAISGGTITGPIVKENIGGSWIAGRDRAALKYTSCTESAGNAWKPLISWKSPSGSFEMGVLSGYDYLRVIYTSDADYTAGNNNSTTCGYFTSGGVFYGACWNDYAEFRTTAIVKAGEVVVENGNGTMHRSYKRLEPAASIVSDTYGFAIGETEKCNTPIAVAGRVLAYPYENRKSYKAGDAVCSAPDGKISKMTREEMVMYPNCIIGYVSEIPEYEVWGQTNVPVDGRIWIKV